MNTVWVLFTVDGDGIEVMISIHKNKSAALNRFRAIINNEEEKYKLVDQGPRCIYWASLRYANDYYIQEHDVNQ